MNRRVNSNGRAGQRVPRSWMVMGKRIVLGQQGSSSLGSSKLVVFQLISKNRLMWQALRFSLRNSSPFVFNELGWGSLREIAELQSEALTRQRPWQASRNRNYLPIQSRFRSTAITVLHFLCLAQDFGSASLGRSQSFA